MDLNVNEECWDVLDNNDIISLITSYLCRPCYEYVQQLISSTAVAILHRSRYVERICL
jgi:hypothetical protein